MMRFTPPPEPADFEQQVRKAGNNWLVKNSTTKPKDFWSTFKPQLAQGFQNLCGYAVMYIPSRMGTVDHYLSKSKAENRHLIYEWKNYRYALQRLNSCKGTYDRQILDPFEVEDNWFEIILPSCQLILTDMVPTGDRDRVQFTIKQLQLQNSEWVIEQRQEWYRMYLENELNLEGLEKKAPLIARAVRKQLN
ncbi:hypothetical protein C7B67_18230 [filamentous cyanobacterium Phorm 6]|nr:hypothetical protein C7B67_18230 [filamentous cyanobacterium Phorm 6]